MSKYFTKAKDRASADFRTDPNINRVKRNAGPIIRAVPPFAADYALDKFPIVHWLPHYDYRWLFQDVIAGITIGVMFIPQGLAYAKIATIPLAHGLYSAWFPSALYMFLGTSKELSTGPTSILGLLTSEAVSALAPDYTAAQVASAMAFMVGVYAVALGIFKLGFLLDFVSAPVLSGWITAVAIVIAMNQVDSLIGMDAGKGTAHIIRYILSNLWEIKPLTLCIGFTGIAVLFGLEQVGKRWGKKNKWIKILSTSRAVIVIFIYTLISWGVNHNRHEDDYAWSVTKVDTNGLLAPKAHDTELLTKIVPRSFAPLIAMSVEHLGVGKAFGVRNGYTIDTSQELFFLGVNNMVNSLFGAMTTGGAMSRTAVNSECGVRSPLNFIFTAGVIILTLYELAPALYWIPKATLAAIVIMAVVHLVAPPRVFYKYWRVSFIDFVASQLALWVTLFTSTEIGLATSVGFCIVYTLLRLAFPRWIGLSHSETENQHLSLSSSQLANTEVDVPPEAYLVRYTDDILFPNANRVKNAILDNVKVHYEPSSTSAHNVKTMDRSWNVSSHKRIERSRRRKNITPFRGEESPLRYVVLDFSMVGFIDTTGIFSIMELKLELRRYIGKDLQFRFFGMNEPVRERFDRSKWSFAQSGETRAEDTDVTYSSLITALLQEEGDEKHELVQEKTLEV